MYYILIRYYYYYGTHHAIEDGPLATGLTTVKEQWHRDGKPGWPRMFETVQDAKDYLAKHGITRQLSPQKFSEDGVYVLAHGEYERPDYWIRKCRTNKQHNPPGRMT